jgi:pimeloyl-ACP methyl ester carboxylesterase
MLHGFGAGVALWSLNLDDLCKDRTVYAIDLPGFGRSYRPKLDFSSGEDVEYQLVQAIEKWRIAVGLDEKFIILGHSFGGYLAASYALQFPDHVAHVVLADPWGVPSQQTTQATSNGQYALPTWVKFVAQLMFNTFNPLSGLRAAGPWGPTLVHKLRPDIKRKFEDFIGEEDSPLVLDYVYHCNAQDNPAGEKAFKALTLAGAWARYPIITRIVSLHPDIELTFIYGSKSWIDRQPGFQIKYLLRDRLVNVQVIHGAGHHVYADRPEIFNEMVMESCNCVDERMKQIALEINRDSDTNLHDQD